MPVASNQRSSIGARSVRWPSVAVALLLSAGALDGAEEPSGVRLSFAAYGTLGVVYSSEDRADFVGSALEESGAGFTHSWSPEVDSRIGAQVTATFTPELSAVVQVVAEQQYDGSYTPHLEWANVKYQLNPDANVRVGRIVLPVFLVSDYRKVGYANVWVRPPVEVYGLVPLTSIDGIDASYRIELGGFTSTFQANFGQNDSKVPGGTELEGRRYRGLTVSAERGATLVRLGYQQADLRIEAFNRLFDGFRQFGPEGGSIADRYDVDGSAFGVYVVGAQYDPGAWFVMAEAGQSRSRTALGDHTVWHVSGGYRFARLTPYLIYSSLDTRDRPSEPGLTLAAYPPELRATAAGLNAALNANLAARSQNGVSIGARWELSKSFDLKVQYDHKRLGAGSRGRLSNLQPGFALGGSYDLISVAVDFVF